MGLSEKNRISPARTLAVNCWMVTKGSSIVSQPKKFTAMVRMNGHAISRYTRAQTAALRSVTRFFII